MRGHVVAMSGELVRTVLFLWFAFAGNQVASQSAPAATVLEPQGIMFIALSYGMSLLVVAWAFYRISGGFLILLYVSSYFLAPADLHITPY